MNSLTEAEAATFMADKKDFWQLCERNGYHMPDFNSPIITLDFLRDTKNGKVYVPLYSSLILRGCPEPPS